MSWVNASALESPSWFPLLPLAAQARAKSLQASITVPEVLHRHAARNTSLEEEAGPAGFTRPRAQA